MTEPSAVLPQIAQIPLTDLVIPPWNPRHHLDEAEMAQLLAFLQKGGSVQRILVWSANGQAPWSVVSGQRRSEAYRRLGRAYIEAEVLPVSLEEAQLLAETSNNGAEPYWLDKYENWEALMKTRGWSQPDLADQIGRAQSAISRGMTLLKVLNPASRALIRQYLAGKAPNLGENYQTLITSDPPPTVTSPIPEPAYQSLINITPGASPAYQTLIASPASAAPTPTSKPSQPVLVENVAYQLTALLANRPLEQAQALAAQALPRLLQGGMTAPQAAQWVKHLLSGQDPAQFQPNPARAKAKPDQPHSSKTQTTPSAPSPTHQPSHAQPAPLNTTTGAKELAQANRAPRLEGSSASSFIGTGTTKASASAGSLNTGEQLAGSTKEPAQANRAPRLEGAEQLAWDALVGISPVARIKAKIKKGERPSLVEALILAEHGLWTGLVWVFQHAFKLAKGIGKETWRLTKNSLKVVLKALGRTVYNFVRVVFALAVLGLLAWLAYDLSIRGFHWGQALEDIFSVVQQAAVIFWKYR